MGAHAARVSELARHWVKAGHQVTVLTGFPNHPTGVVFPEYRSKFRRLICREWVDGVRVVRTWLLPLPNRKPLERILNYTSFCVSSCLTGIFLPRPNVVIATSPQLLVGITGWWIGFIKRVPFIFEVRDLWPESIIASGVGNKTSGLFRSVRALAAFLYRSCHHLVAVTPAIKEVLLAKWNVSPEKVSVVTNGVETDIFSPDGATGDVKSRPEFRGKFVVSYIGTLGLAHGLNTVLEAAAQMKNTFPNMLFLFVGEGADKERLLSLAREKGLANVLFLPQQPRKAVPDFIRDSDVCLVPLKKDDVFKTVIPSKMLEFMACGKPVVLGVEGQALQVLEEAGAGVSIEPENPVALTEAVIKLYQDEGLRRSLGENGRKYVVESFSRKETARTYIDVLERVVLSRGRRGA